MKKLALLAILTGCGGEQRAAPPVVAPAPADAAPAARQLTFEPFRLEVDGVVVEVQKPVGWQRATHLGPSSASFVDPESSEEQQSNFTIAIDCAGLCDTRTKNLAAHTDEMVASWEKYEGYTAAFLTREKLPGGGFVDEIEFSHAELGMIYVYHRVQVVGDALPAGWCKVQAAGTALSARDQLEAACAAATVTAAGK